MMVRKLKHKKQGLIRIIGGKWRGRKLRFFYIKCLRPTKERIRETLFDWLAPVIRETRCLDCFSGSGSLAIEALSRHANLATLIELERSIATQLATNLVKLEARDAQIINTDILNYLEKVGTPYDIVFLDPPFRKNLLAQTASLLEQNGWLSKNSWIYIEVEAEANLDVLPKNWQLHRKKLSKNIGHYLYIRC